MVDMWDSVAPETALWPVN